MNTLDWISDTYGASGVFVALAVVALPTLFAIFAAMGTL